MGTNLIIQKADGSLVPIQNRHTATRVTSGKQTWALNAEDTLNITVESPFPQKYNIGDSITVFGRDYKLNRLPKVKRTGMHEFSYDLEFEGIQYDLLRVTYDLTIDTTNNQLQDVQGDSLTGDLRRFMVVLIANANRVFPGKWKLGTCPETIGDKTLTFGESDNCLSVLQNLCGESNFGVEFEIETADGIHTVNLKERVGQTLPYTFMYGKGNGLYALNRDNVSNSNIVTRLKVYGSTENITMKYRADRLCLPGKNKAQSYIEKPEAVMKYGVFEARKNFDNIKPTYTGVVSAIVAGNVLQFKDNSFPFDLNAKEPDGETTKYLIAGVDAKIHFNTGNLAGYDFTVKNYDHATRTFTLNKLTDDRGDVFPSETSLAFQFGVGDEYKITDIAYSEEIEQAAENKLAEEANKYYDQNSQPKVQYGLTVTKEWLKSLVDATDDKVVNVFVPGDYLHVVDDDIDVDKSVRIKSFTRNILSPYDYQLTISDITTNTPIINRVISDLIDIDKIITINNLKDPTRARANWRSSREVLDMVFDPEGDYYTDKIKPNSIDTLALSVGAKSMQFGLTNTVFQPNYNGNKNVIKWQGGVLTHYTINEETAVSWVLADGQLTLDKDSDAYYIYAKCAKGSQAGTIVFTKEQHKVDGDANYYYFWIGVLNSVDFELKARSLALTYGFTMVNGRFIKTGRIESADGTTYFDLDNSEIGGRIVFTSNGQEKTLEELGQEALESKDFINNTLPGMLSEIQSQLDGKIETWFQTTDPAASWTTTALKKKHVGDMWFRTDKNTLWRYSGSYTWQQIQDQKAIDAYNAASTAQDTADGKRRVFVTTPKPPYDIGDLWVDGKDLRRCITKRTTGSYVANDWVVAVNYDNTKTIIDGGIVTSGTIQVAGDNKSILAGITGQGTAATSIRFWAGASFENRATAPYRVMQDGSVVMTKATVEGIINAISGYIGGFKIQQGQIGYGSSSEQDTTTGLALLRDFIRFNNGQQRVLLGCLSSLGYPFNGLMELTGTMGTTLELHHKYASTSDESLEHWYRPKALAVFGNQYNLGKIAMFEKGYIGQAYTDIIQTHIGITHKYLFTSTGTSTFLGINLPTKSQIDSITGNVPVQFDLEIVCDRTMPNKIRIYSKSGAYVYDNNGNVITSNESSKNGIDMAKGDVLRLRYYNGGWNRIFYHY
ncbi:hypothetical protein IMSAGC016_00082 [Muribaculaceae bacterium]|nr:hypothetical protein IMSAGC016_00082 [Muribaculaceae bacterium]